MHPNPDPWTFRDVTFSFSHETGKISWVDTSTGAAKDKSYDPKDLVDYIDEWTAHWVDEYGNSYEYDIEKHSMICSYITIDPSTGKQSRTATTINGVYIDF